MTTLDPKDPDVDAWYQIDWHDDLVPQMERDTEYALDVVVRPPFATGWYYRWTPSGGEATGRTAAREPRLPRAAGAAVEDGSGEWTTVHPNDGGVPIVASANWSVPDGISLVAQNEAGSKTQIKLSGGTDGEDYDLTCRMTPTNGDPIEQTITVQVRAQ